MSVCPSDPMALDPEPWASHSATVSRLVCVSNRDGLAMLCSRVLRLGSPSHLATSRRRFERQPFSSPSTKLTGGYMLAEINLELDGQPLQFSLTMQTARNGLRSWWMWGCIAEVTILA